MTGSGKSDSETNGLVRVACERAGLVPATVEKHSSRIRAVTGGAKSVAFKIETTCRVENGGVLRQDVISGENAGDRAKNRLKAVAFVPAAGAASRFLEPLKPLAAALADGNIQLALQRVKEIIPADSRWPLPALLEEFIDAAGRSFSTGEMASLVDILSWPKALFPCNNRGVSFLEAKVREHSAFCESGVSFLGEVYIAPPGRGHEFKVQLDAFKAGNKAANTVAIPHVVLEQGGALSTLRFWRDGSPVLDDSGNASVVPAGHGALVNLFDAVTRTFPDGDYLLIRNVDNVCGTGSLSRREVLRFCSFAEDIIRSVREARSLLEKPGSGWNEWRNLLEFFAALSSEVRELVRVADDVRSGEAIVAALIGVQRHVFHSPDHLLRPDGIRYLFDRPVNVLGQVPNSGKDVGGTPVFVVRPDGVHEKLCIEVAHVTPEQVESVLKNPVNATHFNPVFVASELSRAVDFYEADHPYWSVVQKRFEGKDVFYHESFLYEILGSSSLSNVVFVEIPRLLFNPHKTLSDAASGSIEL